jgi:hypothetical protein
VAGQNTLRKPIQGTSVIWRAIIAVRLAASTGDPQLYAEAALEGRSVEDQPVIGLQSLPARGPLPAPLGQAG